MSKATNPADISIDRLMQRSLVALQNIIRASEADAATGTPTRNAVMNLRDAMAILQTLKEQEDDILDKLSDEELAEAAETK